MYNIILTRRTAHCLKPMSFLLHRPRNLFFSTGINLDNSYHICCFSYTVYLKTSAKIFFSASISLSLYFLSVSSETFPTLQAKQLSVQKVCSSQAFITRVYHKPPLLASLNRCLKSAELRRRHVKFNSENGRRGAFY